MTTTVTAPHFNPFLPAIGRIYEVLLHAAPAGATIETNNRQLAEAAGLKSASQIPAILRKLESLGYIERITSPRGSLIVVTDRSDMDDRSFAAFGCDQGISDRPAASDSANPNETLDRSIGAISNRSDMVDPPLHPPIRYSLESSQEEESARAMVTDSVAQSPLYRRLVAAPRMDRPLASKIAAAPPGDLAAFEADLALAQQLAHIRAPFWFTVHRWANGQRVVAQEPCHAPQRPATPARARRGPHADRSPRPAAAGPYPGGLGDPAADAERAAILALLAAQRAVPV